MSTEGMPPTFPGSPPPPRPDVWRLLREAAVSAAVLVGAAVFAVAAMLLMGALWPVQLP